MAVRAGAGVVAAAHDGYESGNFVVDCGNGVIELFVRSAPVQQLLGHVFKTLDRLGANDKVEKWKPVLEIFLGTLRGTPGDYDLPAGFLSLPPLEPSDFRKCAIFRMLAHRTRVDQHDGCIVRILRFDQSAGLEMS